MQTISVPCEAVGWRFEAGAAVGAKLAEIGRNIFDTGDAAETDPKRFQIPGPPRNEK